MTQRERERALLPHKPSAVLLRLEVSGAREDLIQDSCVKGFGRNAFIRDIALLSLPLSSFSLLMCSHPFHQPKLRGGRGGGSYCGSSRSLYGRLIPCTVSQRPLLAFSLVLLAFLSWPIRKGETVNNGKSSIELILLFM